MKLAQLYACTQLRKKPYTDDVFMKWKKIHLPSRMNIELSLS